MLEAGTIVGGKYRLERLVGRGGMGLVMQATHLQLHQPVAIKFLGPEAAQHPETVQRFLREARAAVRLRGEHIARVIDVSAFEIEVPYMVLEYLEGTDLARFPRAQLNVGTLVDLMLQACEALAEAHSLGIVHRDIKPSNFFVTRDPGGALLLKLLDFGISKILGEADKLTASQVVLGTPAYMSPEQVRASKQIDRRSDIWSLGIVLYELLEGVSPFESDAFSATVLRIVNDAPAKLTARLPAGLDGIIYRCLEKDPDNRFQRVAELAVALAPYAGSSAQATITLERMRGLSPVPRRRGGDPGAAGLADTVASAPASKRARRWRRTLLVAIPLAIGAVIAVIASLPDGAPTPPATSSTAGAPLPPAPLPSALSEDVPAAPAAAPVAGSAASPSSPSGPAPASAVPPAPASRTNGSATPRSVDADAVLAGEKSTGAAAPRPSRPRPNKNTREPVPPEVQHDSPKTTAPHRFDRGD